MKQIGSAVSVCVVVIFILLNYPGCASIKGEREPESPEDSLRRTLTEEERRRATQHFVEGSLLEMQGDHEGAIIEFTEALKYDDDPAIYYALSKNYIVLDRIGLAAEMGRKAVEREPGNVSYRENLAHVYLNAHEIDEAIQQYEHIVELEPDNINVYYNLARLYQFSQPHKALEVYERILNRFGDQFEILAQVADIKNSLGRHDEAAEAIKRMIDIDPGNVGLLLTLGNTYMRGELYEKARDVFLELYEMHPDDIDVLTSLVDVYVYMQEYEEATGYIDSVIKKEEIPLEAKIGIGEVYYAHMQRDSSVVPIAKAVFDAIIDQHPDAVQAFWYRGAIGSITGDHETALTNFIRVTELDPENADAWVLASSIYFENSEFESLIQFAEEGMQYHPDEFDLVFLLGLGYNRIERLEDAAETLSKAVSLSPENINALSMLALTYDSKEIYTKSDSLYEIALELDPDNHLVLNNYSYSFAERGIYLDRALEMSTRAVEMEPENSAYLDTLGWIYFKMGDIEKAKMYVRKAIDVGSTSAVVHDHMGDIYYHLDEHERAMEYWKKSLEFDDTKDEVREKIERGSL